MTPLEVLYHTAYWSSIWTQNQNLGKGTVAWDFFYPCLQSSAQRTLNPVLISFWQWNRKGYPNSKIAPGSDIPYPLSIDQLGTWLYCKCIHRKTISKIVPLKATTASTPVEADPKKSETWWIQIQRRLRPHGIEFRWVSDLYQMILELE